MTLFARITFVSTVTVLAAACGTSDIAQMPVKGGAFETGLRDGYVRLADSEYDQTDIVDAMTYSERAKMSAMGTPPLPDDVAARKLAAPHLAEVTDARARLMSALGKRAAGLAPADAANAQVMFDCWVEQAEENIQPEDIAECRSGFMAAMERVEAALAPKAVAAKPAPAKRVRKPETTEYVIYFGHDSATLDKAAMAGIDIIKLDVKKAARISVEAFADRSGQAAYNNILATKRAKAVVSALERAGVQGEIATTVYGEDRNAIRTRDGVREKLNRRVEISVTQ